MSGCIREGRSECVCAPTVTVMPLQATLQAVKQELHQKPHCSSSY